MGDDTRSLPSGHASVSTPRANDRRRESADAWGVAARHVADTHPHAVFVLDHEGTVLLMNPAARRLAGDRSKIFQVRKQRLLIQAKSVEEWFDGRRESVLLLRPSSSERNPRHEYGVVLSRTSLKRARDPFTIIVYERHRARSVAESLLQQLYQLTPSESATAAQLFRGLRLTEVAEALGVSIHTVRSHAKRVFTKCHVKSQSELVRLLALGPGIQ